MPALQNLVLTDRASTPVNHTFTPFELKDGVGVVVESSGVKLGDSKFSITSRKTGNGRFRAQAKLEVPVVENAVINGITTPTVVRIGYITVEASFHEGSSTAERNNLVGMMQSAFTANKDLVNKTFVDLEGVWG